MSQTLRLHLGDCVEVLTTIGDGQIGAIITDPPYGISMMNKTWDAPWKVGAEMTSPGIGDRAILWPSFTGNHQFGGTNPTCAICGGRGRGSRRCDCDEPDWKVCGESLADSVMTGIKQKQFFQEWCGTWLTECYRVLQPGGLAKVFGATRMFHRLAAAMEDAGFILDPEHSIEAWGFGSGFPKSLDVGKALDKAAGVEREILAPNKDATRYLNGLGGADFYEEYGQQTRNPSPLTAPATEEAQRFDGYGTALKPGWEPFIVGRKPR